MTGWDLDNERAALAREETRAFVCFLVIVFSLAGLLLLAVAAVRDQTVIDHHQPRPAKTEVAR